jgi:hypothetical protein
VCEDFIRYFNPLPILSMKNYYLIVIFLHPFLVIVLINVLLNVNNTTYKKITLLEHYQTVFPPIPWDWDKEAKTTGFLPLDMINFVNALPLSCESYDNFNFSSQTLYANYHQLLALVNNDFEPQKQLNEAQRLAQRPQSLSANSEIPLGWCKITDESGMIRFSPSYNMSLWPKDCLNEIKKRELGLTAQSQTIYIPISIKPFVLHKQYMKRVCDKIFSTNQEQDLLLKITTKMWTRVIITPDVWFNSGIIQLIKAHKGSFKGKYDIDTLFGYQGLMSCRTSELLVAYKPDIEIITNYNELLYSFNTDFLKQDFFIIAVKVIPI